VKTRKNQTSTYKAGYIHGGDGGGGLNQIVMKGGERVGRLKMFDGRGGGY